MGIFGGDEAPSKVNELDKILPTLDAATQTKVNDALANGWTEAQILEAIGK